MNPKIALSIAFLIGLVTAESFAFSKEDFEKQKQQAMSELNEKGLKEKEIKWLYEGVDANGKCSLEITMTVNQYHFDYQKKVPVRTFVEFAYYSIRTDRPKGYTDIFECEKYPSYGPLETANGIMVGKSCNLHTNESEIVVNKNSESKRGQSSSSLVLTGLGGTQIGSVTYSSSNFHNVYGLSKNDSKCQNLTLVNMKEDSI